MKDLIEQCGGMTDDARKLILGGPMMGLLSLQLMYCHKRNLGRFAFNRKGSKDIHSSLHKCGRCVDVCPMRLLPNLLGSYVEMGLVEEAEKAGAMDCFECGSLLISARLRGPLCSGSAWLRGNCSAQEKVARRCNG